MLVTFDAVGGVKPLSDTQLHHHRASTRLISSHFALIISHACMTKPFGSHPFAFPRCDKHATYDLVYMFQDSISLWISNRHASWFDCKVFQ